MVDNDPFFEAEDTAPYGVPLQASAQLQILTRGEQTGILQPGVLPDEGRETALRLAGLIGADAVRRSEIHAHVERLSQSDRLLIAPESTFRAGQLSTGAWEFVSRWARCDDPIFHISDDGEFVSALMTREHIDKSTASVGLVVNMAPMARWRQQFAPGEQQVQTFASYIAEAWGELESGKAISELKVACPFVLTGDGNPSDDELECAAHLWRSSHLSLQKRRLCLLIQRLFGVPVGLAYNIHIFAIVNSIAAGNFAAQLLGLRRFIRDAAFEGVCDLFNVEVRDPCRTKGTGAAGEKAVQAAVRLGVAIETRRYANAAFRDASSILHPNLKPLFDAFPDADQAARQAYYLARLLAHASVDGCARQTPLLPACAALRADCALGLRGWSSQMASGHLSAVGVSPEENAAQVNRLTTVTTLAAALAAAHVAAAAEATDAKAAEQTGLFIRTHTHSHPRFLLVVGASSCSPHHGCSLRTFLPSGRCSCSCCKPRRTSCRPLAIPPRWRGRSRCRSNKRGTPCASDGPRSMTRATSTGP